MLEAIRVWRIDNSSQFQLAAGSILRSSSSRDARAEQRDGKVKKIVQQKNAHFQKKPSHYCHFFFPVFNTSHMFSSYLLFSKWQSGLASIDCCERWESRPLTSGTLVGSTPVQPNLVVETNGNSGNSSIQVSITFTQHHHSYQMKRTSWSRIMNAMLIFLYINDYHRHPHHHHMSPNRTTSPKWALPHHLARLISRRTPKSFDLILFYILE